MCISVCIYVFYLFMYVLCVGVLADCKYIKNMIYQSSGDTYQELVYMITFILGCCREHCIVIIIFFLQIKQTVFKIRKYTIFGYLVKFTAMTTTNA
ncbi:hypothetical protein BDA99DRAFT_279089 [Phascolomyces articulosus]|uniref:Uncharacterized protein n=1 Tax=Phascolomyces articulosus TaxID=60185 RepID=A0AAD5K800_9FUNG|nr:hypothetical protein BDA99DRAFT_279089 [Phascolomyces articulosus]